MSFLTCPFPLLSPETSGRFSTKLNSGQGFGELESHQEKESLITQFSRQFLFWHISPGDQFKLEAFVTRLIFAGRHPPLQGSLEPLPVEVKGRRWSLGESLKTPRHTGSGVRAVAFRGAYRPQLFSGPWPPCSGLPLTEPPAVGVQVWRSGPWTHVDLGVSQHSGLS